MIKTPKPRNKPPGLPSFAALLACALLLLTAALPAQTTGPQRLDFAGLRSVSHQGQVNAVVVDGAGDLYLLLDQQDGVRLLKTNALATTVLAQAQVGAAGDVGLAMALGPAGDLFVSGTSLSHALTATTGAAFPAPVDTTINSFVARFDSSLNLKALTFGGSGRTAASGIAVTADAVFITGLIYGSELPVTPSAIIQAPAYNSTQNGFVEKFSLDGTTLLYATYLSGQNGDTSPTVIAADVSDNAYVAGFTTATGFPTVAALVPRAVGVTSGFLMKLTPAADNILFSTFVPGDGISALMLDASAQNLLMSGSIALGQFPVTSVASPLVHTPYQVLLRMPLDGSAVLSSTLIAPGTQSSLAAGPNGTVWVAGTLGVPLLPLAPVASIGSGFAVRVSPTGTGSTAGTVVDQTGRFGGLAAANPNNASLPLTLTSLAVDTAGSAILAGSVAPTTSASLLATQTFDLPLVDSPTSALPSSVHDAVLAPGSCSGSLCAGTAAYVARLTPVAGASLALSTDASPNLILRNLGSAQATSLGVSATGFTVNTTCGATLASGDECAIALSGNGPGTLSFQAANSASQTVALAAVPSSTIANPLAFSPHEIDFGVASSTSAALLRTITVTNLTQQTQVFTSAGPANQGRNAATPAFAESASDCPLAGLNTSKQLAAGATCHITLSFTASSGATKDGLLQSSWTIGAGSVLVTGVQQAAALSLSASTIDFGTQFAGGLRSARQLYLSNNSSGTVSHAALQLSAGSPFTLTDGCPAQLQPHTVCGIQFSYLSPVTTSSDSTTLNLDQGLSVTISGATIPPPGTSGSGSAPSLAVSPSTITFTDAVVVTGVSGGSQTVTIHNTGTSSFPLALALTGDFTNQTSCGANLAAGASCSAVLTFAPAQPGSRTGLLSITDGSTAPVYVNLSGAATAILPANNGTLDSGTSPVGQPSVQWYKVSQPFSTLTAATLTGAFKVLLVEDVGYGHGAPASSAFLQATSGSCLNCWLGVQFTPSAAGSANDTLTLSSAATGNPYLLSLTGVGLSPAGILLSPATQDFGSISVNSSSAALAFVVTNLSSSATPITLNAPSLAGDFSLAPATGAGVCGSALNPNASCTLSVLFAPTATGQRTGSLTVATSGGSATSSLTGFGAPDAGIAFNPSGLIFSNVAGATATVQTITVTNTGSSAASVGAPANASTAFTTATTCATLVPAGSCTLTVTYTPGTATVSDTIQLPVTIAAGGNSVLTTYTLPLTGAYTSNNSGLQIVPGTADYGPSAVNAIAGARAFTVSNLTAKDLTLSLNLPRQFVLTGAPCSSLAAGASCTFSTSFLPATNGATTGTLYVTGAPSDASAAVTGSAYLKGYGQGTNTLAVTGNLSPGRLVDFGQVPSGQSVAQTLTLTNSSSAAVSSSASTITIHRITSQWPFLSTTNCGLTLTSGQSCTVVVTYTPLDQVATGSTSTAVADGGALLIESDAVSGPDQITLAGMATPVAVSSPANTAPVLALTASQSSLSFSATGIGFTSPAQTVVLTNTGSTVLHVARLTASTDFNVTGSCPVVVPGATCPLTIAFTPQISASSSSARAGTVEIATDSSTSLEFLSLLGTATPSNLTFAPASLDFGTQLVGTSATQPITITNIAATAVTFTGITTTGDYAVSGTCPANGSSLAANASCTLQLTFTPTTTAIRPGTVSLASSASTVPLTAMLTGVGVQSHLSISPTALSFGDVPVGAASSLSLTLANTGTAAITGITLKATGDFAVTSPCAFTTLSAGVSCSVTLAFTPSVAGARTGSLLVTNSDPASPSTVPLTGNGLAAPTMGSFTLTVNGANSASQTVRQTLPATYTLSLAPVGGFAGNVVLSCTAVNSGTYSTCSLPTSTLTLSGAAQTATVTINTVASAALHHPTLHVHLRRSGSSSFCLLIPAVLLFWRFRRTLTRNPASLLLALLCVTMMMFTAGCGSGSVSNFKYTSPGTYQYTVTASSTSGTPVSQTVTLNMIITQ